ncbi:Cyanovirin-N [Tricladium varicosporioides]|nr:Cyanovirin-N [Hymenoscyphus varicosporioides]
MKLSLLLIATAVQQTIAAALAGIQFEDPKQLEKRTLWSLWCTSGKGQYGLVAGTTIFWAHCQRIDGSWNYTELELNNCFYNDDGFLKFGGAGLAQTCDNYWLADGLFGARCRAISGDEIQSVVDLNNYISNQDGNLTCD